MRRVFAVLLAAVALCSADESASAGWKPLFDGKSLAGWRTAEFNRAGQPKLQDGTIVLVPGAPLTGINYTGKLANLNYEVRFEATRTKGNDFFASLTFPVRNAYGTWVTGGWGGDIVGLSSLDGWDASENETRTYINFEENRWYSFRLRVTDERITAWIDNEKTFDVSIAGRTVSLRPGPIEASTPFGFASYNTEGRLRNIQFRPIQTGAAQ